MIFFFGVDRPHGALVGVAGGDVVVGYHGGHHRVVHVVVAVLPVAADAPQVFDAVEELLHPVELIVAAEVGGVGLLDLDAYRVEYIGGVDDTDSGQLAHRHVDELPVVHLPKGVTFGTEVFESYPHGILIVLDQIGRPVVEDLQAADAHVALLNVDPGVGYAVGKGLDAGLIVDGEAFHEQPHGDEVAVGQVAGNAFYLVRYLDALNRLHEVFERKRREQVVAGDLPAFALGILDGNARHAVVLDVNLLHGSLGNHLSAPLAHLVGHGLPQLPGPQFGIDKLFDKRGFHLFYILLFGEALFEHVFENGKDRQPLHPLGTPVGPQF